MASFSEARLIEIIKGAHQQELEAGNLGIGDDGAFINLTKGLITTTDMLVEGADFDLSWAAPRDIGHKSLAVNLSDLAAMGAKPVGYLLSLALPSWVQLPFVAELAAGLAEVANNYHCPLFGGDLSATGGPLIINIVAFGEPVGTILKRRQGIPGQNIFVAGTLGSAAAGLHLLQNNIQLRELYPQLVRAQLRPEPLLSFADFLARQDINISLMDVSDGLASDLPRLLAPGLGARIDFESLPISVETSHYASRYGLDLAEMACCGGEDYALLFTADKALEDIYRQSEMPGKVYLAKIGEVTDSGSCYLERDGRQSPLGSGFDHFCK